ncbi:MAG: ABC transporter ATP-binding protein [Verrucomicrobiota bacterium]
MNAEEKTLAVEVRGLTKRFKLNWRRGALLALDSLDMQVEQGQIFGLLGPNGSGKSTTMKCLLGLVQPTEGSARILGYDSGSMEARNRVGFLPENPYFPSFLNGYEVLRYYGGLSGITGKALKERSDELLELVSLTHAAARPLRTYSKGMLQRIGLAQALLHDPQVLFLDEPTAGVDPIGSRQMRDLMIRLRDEGKTVVFSSHLLEQVEEISDRVVILHQGQKLCEGSLEELLELPDAIEIQVTDADQASENEIREVLTRAGIKNVVIRRPRLSLEAFFIRKVMR